MIRRLNILVLGLLLCSCQQEPDNKRLFDQLVVSTNYDPQVRFGSYTTYAMPTDTIGFVSNNSNDTILTATKSDFPRPVLETIRVNLNSRGYTRVQRNQNPDLGVNVYVVNDFNIFQEVIYPGGGYGYPGSY